MLSESLLERMTNAGSVRSFGASNNRRGDVRVPVSIRAEGMPVEHDRIGAVTSVRIRDLSLTGVGLMVPARTRLTPEIVIGISPKGFDTHWLTVRVRRASVADGICALIGGTWNKILYPGQDVQPGMKMSSLLWVDSTAEGILVDPFLEEGGNSPAVRPF